MPTPTLPPEVARLRDAAQAVIDRWDTPLWKDAPATGVFINRLRDALAHLSASAAAQGEAVYQLRAPLSQDWHDTPKPDYMKGETHGRWYEVDREAFERASKDPTYKARVLYTHPAPPASALAHLSASAAAQGGAVACKKPFFAYDPDDGSTFFASQGEALEYAIAGLTHAREQAKFDGEWSAEVDSYRVGIVTHVAAPFEDDGESCDYRLTLVTAPPASASAPRAQEVAEGWISVDERLPDLGTLVLGWDGALGVFSRDYVPGEGWLWARQSYAWNLTDPSGIEADDDYQVTHWKPLPAPPAAQPQQPTKEQQ